MSTSAKIAISIDRRILDRIDSLVVKKIYANRSKAIQSAIEEKIFRIDKTRLVLESAKLNKAEEQKLADESINGDLLEWPEY
jgi:metal-responsive CopG/Arc/MetJ family transcriptional regulator